MNDKIIKIIFPIPIPNFCMYKYTSQLCLLNIICSQPSSVLSTVHLFPV